MTGMKNIKAATAITVMIGGVFVGLFAMTLGASYVGSYMQGKYGFIVAAIGAGSTFLFFLFLIIWFFIIAMEVSDRWL
jgi:hypothetical protein